MAENSQTMSRERPCSSATEAVDLVFLVDASGSLKDFFDTSKKFVKKVVNRLNWETTQPRFAVVKYGATADVEIDLESGISKDDKKKVNDIGGFINPGKKALSCTGLGIQTVRESVLNKARSSAQKIIVVLSDGKETTALCDAIGLPLGQAEADAAREEKVTIMAVAIGDSPSEDTLEALAANSKVYKLKDSNKEDIAHKTAESLCTQLLTPAPTPAPTQAPTPLPTAAPTREPTPEPTPVPTSTPTPMPTSTPLCMLKLYTTEDCTGHHMTYKHGNRQTSNHIQHGIGSDELEDEPPGTPISWKEDHWTYCVLSDPNHNYLLFHSMKLEGNGCEKAGYNDLWARPRRVCPEGTPFDKFDHFLYDLECTKLEDSLNIGDVGVYLKGPLGLGEP